LRRVDCQSLYGVNYLYGYYLISLIVLSTASSLFKFQVRQSSVRNLSSVSTVRCYASTVYAAVVCPSVCHMPV